MNLELENNKVFLQGEVVSEPTLNHLVKDEEFYGFDLRVDRLSGQADIIPIIISKKLLQIHDIKLGDNVALKGQFRSHNKIDVDKRKLVLAVFVKEVCEWERGVNANVIELAGYICKPSIYRTTPFAREICDLLLAVNRNYNKSDYIPCIAWGTNAQYVSRLEVATPLKIVGRVQSREYNKNVDGEMVTKMAYEVSISKIIDEKNDPEE